MSTPRPKPTARAAKQTPEPVEHDLNEPLTEDYLNALSVNGLPAAPDQEAFIEGIVARIPRLTDAALELSQIQNGFMGNLFWRVEAALDAERMARIRQVPKAPTGRGRTAAPGVGQMEAYKAELELRGGSKSSMDLNARIHRLLQESVSSVKKCLVAKAYYIIADKATPRPGPKPDARTAAQKKADRFQFQLELLRRFADYKERNPDSGPNDAEDAVKKEDALLEDEARRRRNRASGTIPKILHRAKAELRLKTLLKYGLLKAKSVRLILIDPPFGLKLGLIKGDKPDQAFQFLKETLLLCDPIVADDAHLMVFTSWKHFAKFSEIIKECDWTVADHPYVWHKTNVGLGQSDTCGPGATMEICIYAYRGNARTEPRIDGLIDADPENVTGHPDQKPLALLRRLIEITTKPGDLVLDYCCGCGSTLVAALKMGRRAIGIEWSRKYYHIAWERLRKGGLI